MDITFAFNLAAVFWLLVTGAPLPPSYQHGWQVVIPGQTYVLDRRAMRCKLSQCRGGVLAVEHTPIPGGERVRLRLVVLNQYGRRLCTAFVEAVEGGVVLEQTEDCMHRRSGAPRTERID